MRQMSLIEWAAWLMCSDTCVSCVVVLSHSGYNVGVPRGTLTTKGSGGSFNKQSQSIKSVQNKQKR